MFAVLNIEIIRNKWIYVYKTADINELSYYNKVKVNRSNKQYL